jgi:hypothetical protein
MLEAESLTASAAKDSTTVPSEQEATVTVTDEPEAAEGEKVQLVAVPVLAKSAAVRPVTGSEKVST